METSRNTTARPSPDLVGHHAAEIAADCQLSPDGKTLLIAGFPAYRLPPDEDMALLCRECFRALALKFAVANYDGDCAEIVLPPMVAEGLHIVLDTTGRNLMLAAMNLTVFDPDANTAPCQPGSYTWSCYEAAGWGPPPPIWHTAGAGDTTTAPTATPR